MLAGVGGLAALASVSGCLGVLGQDDSVDPDNQEHLVTFELEGDGPGEPVMLTLGLDGFEHTRALNPGDAFSYKEIDGEDEIEIDIEYEEDELEVEVEWAFDGVEVEVDLEQDDWSRTSAQVGFTEDDEGFETEAAVEVITPASETMATLVDSRGPGPWEIDLEIDVENGDEIEVEFDLERDD